MAPLSAEKIINGTIRVLCTFKDSSGERLNEFFMAKVALSYKSVYLKSNQKVVSINKNQFLQSLDYHLNQ